MIGTHVLAIGFLLANVAFIKAAGRGSESSMTIYPHSSDLVAKLLDDFDIVVTKYVNESQQSAPAPRETREGDGGEPDRADESARAAEE